MNKPKPHARKVDTSSNKTVTARKTGKAAIDDAVGAGPGTIHEKPAGYATNLLNGKTEPFYKPGWHSAGIVRSGMANQRSDAVKRQLDEQSRKRRGGNKR